MNYEEAAALVAADQNAGVDTERGEALFTVEEAVAHARRILTVETLIDYSDDEYEDKSYEAYRIVLTQDADGHPL